MPGGLGTRPLQHDQAFVDCLRTAAPVNSRGDRIVDEGDVITARGVTSSIDAGLYVVERVAGAEARDRIARQMDYPYVWKDAAAHHRAQRNPML